MNQVLAELWEEHLQAKFPKGYGGVDVNDICVTSIDSSVSGCISTYAKRNDGCIDIERFQVLQKCKVELESVLKFLDGESYEYFSRLYFICREILKDAKIA